MAERVGVVARDSDITIDLHMANYRTYGNGTVDGQRMRISNKRNNATT